MFSILKSRVKIVNLKEWCVGQLKITMTFIFIFVLIELYQDRFKKCSSYADQKL